MAPRRSRAHARRLAQQARQQAAAPRVLPDDVTAFLAGYRSTGVDDAAWAAWIEGVFAGYRCDDAATLATMRDVHERHGLLIDPHTAVGLSAAMACARDGVPTITLATAHPAKFPDAVERATGIRPELPEHVADLFSRAERSTDLPNDLSSVERFVASVRRAL